jgi:hypothetical protein
MIVQKLRRSGVVPGGYVVESTTIVNGEPIGDHFRQKLF